MFELVEKAPNTNSPLPYTVEDRYYYYFPKTTTIDIRTFEKGWYFVTETEDLNGPYSTKTICKFELEFYGHWLATGFISHITPTPDLTFWDTDKTVGHFRESIITSAHLSYNPIADYIFCSDPLQPKTFYCFAATKKEQEIVREDLTKMGKCKEGFLSYFYNKKPVGYFSYKETV